MRDRRSPVRRARVSSDENDGVQPVAESTPARFATLDVHVAGSASASMIELIGRPVAHARHRYLLGQTFRVWRGSHVDGVLLVYSRQVAKQTEAFIDEQLYLLAELGSPPIVAVMDGCVGVSRDVIDEDEAALREKCERFGLDANSMPILRTSADIVLRGTEPWASEFHALHEAMDRTFLPTDRGGRERLIFTSSGVRLGRVAAQRPRALSKSRSGRPLVSGQVIQGEINVGDEADLLVAHYLRRIEVTRIENDVAHEIEIASPGAWVTLEIARLPGRSAGGPTPALVAPGMLVGSRTLTITVHIAHVWQSARGKIGPSYRVGQYVQVTLPPGCLPHSDCRVGGVDYDADGCVLRLESQRPIVHDSLDPEGPVIVRGEGTAVGRIIRP
jgi:hypothetical protein